MAGEEKKWRRRVRWSSSDDDESVDPTYSALRAAVNRAWMPRLCVVACLQLDCDGCYQVDDSSGRGGRPAKPGGGGSGVVPCGSASRSPVWSGNQEGDP